MSYLPRLITFWRSFLRRMKKTEALLPLEVQHWIKKNYGGEVVSIKLLGQGFKGSVFQITVGLSGTNSQKIFCLKCTAKNHVSTLQDYKLYQIAYNDFEYKNYKDDKYRFYFTLPHFEGATLSEINFKTLNLSTRLTIFQAIVKQQKLLASQGILHRDLKLDNIVVSLQEDIKVKIIDFGRATQTFDPGTGKPLSDIKSLELSDSGKLQPFFMRHFQSQTAPEYITLKSRRSSSQIGFCSDQYSLAKIFVGIVPEYKHLAYNVITTSGTDRTYYFYKLVNQANSVLTSLGKELKDSEKNTIEKSLKKFLTLIKNKIIIPTTNSTGIKKFWNKNKQVINLLFENKPLTQSQLNRLICELRNTGQSANNGSFRQYYSSSTFFGPGRSANIQTFYEYTQYLPYDITEIPDYLKSYATEHPKLM